jgi:PAS domain S-box-containing protein
LLTTCRVRAAREAAGVSLMEECYPDPAYRRQVYRFMEACPDGWMDIRMRARDGRPVETSWANLRLSDGTHVGIGIDLTARKRMEEVSRKATEQLRIVTDSMAVPVTRCGRDLRYRWASKGVADLLGRPLEEIVGRPILDVIGPDAFERLRPRFEQALAGQKVSYEDVVDYRGIGRRWIRAVYTPTRDAAGVPDGWVAVVIDLTEHRRLEEALRESEARLTAELEAVSRLHALSTRLLAVVDIRAALDDLLENAVGTAGADFGNVQLYNPQTRSLEIVAQQGFRQDFLDHFRAVRVEDGSACARAMQTGERILIEDVQADPSFEPHRHAAAAADFRGVTSTPLKDRGGAVIGMLSVHFRRPYCPSERDRRLLDLYARHAADLVERSRFEEALRDADRRKDEFLATLAHELRNPLAPIRNAVQVLKAKGPANPDLMWARDVIDRQVGQMARLLEDLLDVSRITRNKLELRKRRVTLADVMVDAVETSRPVIDGGGHALAVILPPEPVHLDADPVRLAQVFSNLLNNAAKYTDRGGHIRLAAEVAGGEVAVSVRDTGIGIAADVLPRLFEMFAQAAPALERSQGGLGIGLSLVKGLVEMHGGTVEARSDGPGKGSEFVVRLPVAATPTVGEQPPPDPEKPRAAGCRLVVADDNRDIADTLAMMLTMMGHEVRTAGDGQEAVEVAEAFRPEAVLLDVGMPRLNGYDTARRIRERPWGSGVLLVACTGWGQDDDRRKSQEAGFDFHLVKPVSAATLEKVLAGLRATASEERSARR